MDALEYKSHIGQDRWVAEVLGFRKDGYFLEFGALDGLLTSNTYALEKGLGWQGMCVEANPTSYPAVCANRSCITINAALWPESRQVVEMVDAHGLSSIVDYKDGDAVSDIRNDITTRRFSIDTINPTELLDRFQAPKTIDYLSLDVEGCEIDVLKAIDFNQYRVTLMTVEHSDDVNRQAAIRAIVEPFGYQVIQRFYDDWFYHPTYLKSASMTGPIRNPVDVHAEIVATFVVQN